MPSNTKNSIAAATTLPPIYGAIRASTSELLTRS